MKTIKYLLCLFIIPFIIMSCNKDYDEPPLNKPVYDGSKDNIITIKELKSLYDSIKNGEIALIEPNYMLNAYVTANDKSGNLFKQIYIQDNTGALAVSIDQSNINNTLAVGQEIFINIKELYMTKYGDVLQLGYNNPTPNRIPAAMFDERIHLNDWAKESNAKPTKVDLGNLNTNMIGMLVQLEHIYFKNGGVNNVINDSIKNQNKFTEETILNAQGKSMIIRTSSYANEFVGVLLPKGYGSIFGILGYYNGTWQLLLRDLKDLNADSFDGTTPTPNPEPGKESIFFHEKFANGKKEFASGERYKIADFSEYFDMKSPVTYSDPDGKLDIRSTKTLGNFVWFPKGSAGSLKISGINSTGKNNIKLTYQMTGNIFSAGEQINVNSIKVKCDNNDLSVPDFVLTKDDGYGNKFYTVEINNLVAGFTSLEFYTTSTDNKLGLRLTNIMLQESNSIIAKP